jgi:hypothetical protein
MKKLTSLTFVVLLGATLSCRTPNQVADSNVKMAPNSGQVSCDLIANPCSSGTYCAIRENGSFCEPIDTLFQSALDLTTQKLGSNAIGKYVSASVESHLYLNFGPNRLPIVRPQSSSYYVNLNLENLGTVTVRYTMDGKAESDGAVARDLSNEKMPTDVTHYPWGDSRHIVLGELNIVLPGTYTTSRAAYEALQSRLSAANIDLPIDILGQPTALANKTNFAIRVPNFDEVRLALAIGNVPGITEAWPNRIHAFVHPNWNRYDVLIAKFDANRTFNPVDIKWPWLIEKKIFEFEDCRMNLCGQDHDGQYLCNWMYKSVTGDWIENGENPFKGNTLCEAAKGAREDICSLSGIQQVSKRITCWQ